MTDWSKRAPAAPCVCGHEPDRVVREARNQPWRSGVRIECCSCGRAGPWQLLVDGDDDDAAALAWNEMVCAGAYRRDAGRLYAQLERVWRVVRDMVPSSALRSRAMLDGWLHALPVEGEGSIAAAIVEVHLRRDRRVVRRLATIARLLGMSCDEDVEVSSIALAERIAAELDDRREGGNDG